MHIVIGDIAREAITVTPTTRCEKVYSTFVEQPSIEGIVIVLEAQPIGLVMRTSFFQKLSTKYGFDLFMQRPIELVMDRELLTVDYTTALTEVSTLAMERKQESLYDYVIVTKQKQLYGVVSIRELIMKLSEVQINIAKYSNPLSGLPGNHIIDSTLEKVLGYQRYTVFYIDLDNFKEFNDTYGFKEGDELIKETANIIQNTITTNSKHFVGHIGGDDFIAAVPHYLHEDICRLIISRFEQAILRFYRNEDIQRGYVKTLNRKGELENVPLVSISIAVIQNKHVSISSVDALSKEAAAVKMKCKATEGSVFLTLDDIQKQIY
ncbi:GGDEF domain-containing protein [Oceanobacillus piezotolerans]|uniref:GGDEF domain-containing protein n=1 Tax=Oceanobacillus piezotolerans TaxID=2448030 RepID=A0A498DDX0_9BACI|nr:GGDEF domain-containing protein [Oceanobacillus piezotolerans]RLL48266.1 GGDEF domain-containing protein [Oceanobacillus piezotolerans]